MIFISYAQLVKDVIAWSQQLPRDLDLIVGLPRSGMVPAAVLALHRNIRLTTVNDFRDGRIFTGGFRDQHTEIKTAMVIDDSTLSGRSLAAASETLKHLKSIKIYYGAVYAKNTTGLHYKQVDLPRIFEWNWLHHYWMKQACVDIDGVLCQDPTSAQNNDGLNYLKFLHTVGPKHIPTVQVNTLVTSRLERYRAETVKWLFKHHVSYKKLIMHPAASAIVRRKLNDHGKRKAMVYRDPEYKLFIESSDRQAKEIHKLTGKPVFCTDTMCLLS